VPKLVAASGLATGGARITALTLLTTLAPDAAIEAAAAPCAIRACRAHDGCADASATRRQRPPARRARRDPATKDLLPTGGRGVVPATPAQRRLVAAGGDLQRRRAPKGIGRSCCADRARLHGRRAAARRPRHAERIDRDRAIPGMRCPRWTL
jgi:hypothetical protein